MKLKQQMYVILNASDTQKPTFVIDYFSPVLDADALNCIALRPIMLNYVPVKMKRYRCSHWSSGIVIRRSLVQNTI